MTLIVTVVSPKVIYQSADYRLTRSTGETCDSASQKVFPFTAFRWSAIIAFSGVGHTGQQDVATWLSESLSRIDWKDPVDSLIDALLTANEWLAPLAAKDRRHSFSVGAFVGVEPRFFLISNFETLHGSREATARRDLVAESFLPKRTRTFAFGHGAGYIVRQQRRQLERLVARDPEPPSVVYTALHELNRAVANHDETVSPGCFTAHIRRTGEGGGARQGLGGRPELLLTFPDATREVIDSVVAEHFPEGSAVQSMAIGRSGPSEELHQTQVEDKPNDPNVHNNYGSFLWNRRQDLREAERSFRRALEHDPRHVTAHGNLAIVLREDGKHDAAREHYETALRLDPARSSIRASYVALVLEVEGDVDKAKALVDEGLQHEPFHCELLLQGVSVALARRDLETGRQLARIAREHHGGDADVESAHALTLHAAGSASTAECIDAYRVALALKTQPNLLLNLAQLLFVTGADREAGKRLREAEQAGLEPDAQLEAQFYRYAHTTAPRIESLERITTLLETGARTEWDFGPNIALVAAANRNEAKRLKDLSDAIAGRRPWKKVLDRLVAEEPRA